MSNRVFITGVNGFSAGHLVKRLLSEGLEPVYGGDLQPEPPEGLELNGYFRLDITDPSNVNDVISSVMPDMIFHLAGITQGETSKIYHVNLLGSVYLLEAVRRWVPEARTLLVGSAAEYGHVQENEMPIYETHLCNPITPYGISKHAMVMAAAGFVKNYGIKIVIARPFNIVGAGIPPSLVIGAVLSRIKSAFNDGKEPAVVSVGNCDTERDFIAVEDVVDAYLLMIRSNCWGEVFNICSGEPYCIRKILRFLAENSKRKIEFQEDPSLIRSSDVKRTYGSTEKARRILGFTPKVPLVSALRSAWNSAIGEGD